MSIELTGVYTALITPFLPEVTVPNNAGRSLNISGAIDYGSFENLIEMQIAAGVAGIVVAGSTGESATLSPEEHCELIEFTINKVAGRTAVIAGTGSNSTAETLSITKHAAEAGADAVLVINPYYNKPTQQGLILHHTAVAEAVDIPNIVYNIPGRTGVYMQPDTIIEMAQHKNIVGLKEASGKELTNNFEHTRRIIANTNITVLSGNDDETLDIIRIGGAGTIGVTPNLYPDEMNQMVGHALTNNWKDAEHTNDSFKQFYEAIFLEGNPSGIKTAMAHKGHCLNELRLPLISMSSEGQGAVGSAIARLEP